MKENVLRTIRKIFLILLIPTGLFAAVCGAYAEKLVIPSWLFLTAVLLLLVLIPGILTTTMLLSHENETSHDGKTVDEMRAYINVTEQIKMENRTKR